MCLDSSFIAQSPSESKRAQSPQGPEAAKGVCCRVFGPGLAGHARKRWGHSRDGGGQYCVRFAVRNRGGVGAGEAIVDR